MAKGGGVFVFDMGQPIKVVDIVERMLRLNGKVKKLKGSDEGGVEIKYIGLRRSEKMNEELFWAAHSNIGSIPRFCARKSLFVKGGFRMY